MVSYCQVEGINTFFVVEVSAAAINSYETDMLYNKFCRGNNTAGIQGHQRRYVHILQNKWHEEPGRYI